MAKETPRRCSPCYSRREMVLATRIALVQTPTGRQVHPLCDDCQVPTGTVISDKRLP